jgi:hypothetical protein
MNTVQKSNLLGVKLDKSDVNNNYELFLSNSKDEEDDYNMIQEVSTYMKII